MSQEVIFSGQLPVRQHWWNNRNGTIGFMRRLILDKPLGAIGGLFIVLLFIMALSADIIAPFPYDEPNFANIMVPPGEAGHILGTDYLGRDLLSRIIYGGRISILVSVTTVALAMIIAMTLGIISGWAGGKVDAIIQRWVVNVWMSLPSLLVLLTLASLLGPSISTIIIILSLSGISSSRVVRSAVLSIKEAAYVEAAQAMGSTTPWLLLRHIVPNTFAPVIILATIDFGRIILAEATLSFLGYGIPPPFPTWGQMLSGESLAHFYDGPWTMVWPGAVLTLAVFGSNVFGDALRDILDPRLRGATSRN